MASTEDHFERVRALALSAHKDISAEAKINFYDKWAENYDQDVSLLDYRAPAFASEILSPHFAGDRQTAVVLDIACGTGLVAKQLTSIGFGNFVGVDGSKSMMEIAKNTGLYKDLKLCMLGSQPLPVEHNAFDLVMIIGALSDGQVPVKVVRELCMAAKPGGFICLTTRANKNNLVFKASLEQELQTLVEQALWKCVQVVTIDQWERGVSRDEEGYIPGAVYLYQKL